MIAPAHNLTPPTFAEIVLWMAENLTVIDKAGVAVPLRPNPNQRRKLALLYAQFAAGLPMRAIVLKARQLGISTVVEAFLFALANLIPNFAGFVAAHDDESSSTLFSRWQWFQSHLESALKRPTRYSSRKEILYGPPHGSRLQVQTAGNLSLKRGDTLQGVHLSELAFWRNDSEPLLSVLQTVKRLPGTLVVIESTANGVGGEFYERWNEAMRRQEKNPGDLDGYFPLFFSWLDNPEEYAEVVPAGYAWGVLDEDEIALQKLGASNEQLYWRRRALPELCGGDPELFKQEYPSCPDEAFRTSGRPAIPDRITRQHRKTANEKPYRVRLTWDDGGPTRVRHRVLADDEPGGNCWLVHAFPADRHDYAVGGDVCEGILSDPNDPKSESDWHGGMVLDRREVETVAMYRGRCDADLFGEQLLMAATWYNHAWATPEANDVGLAAALVFKRANYGNTYRRNGVSDLRIEAKDATDLGWKTTAANRDQMIDDWLAANRPDMHGDFEGQLKCRFLPLVGEEETFIVDKTGKRQHRPGAHDDVLFAAMIAWQVHLRCPRQLVSQETRRNPFAGAGYAGGKDLELAAIEAGDRNRGGGRLR